MCFAYGVSCFKSIFEVSGFQNLHVLIVCSGTNRKENTVLRGALNPSIVHVIPNAVVVSQFKPVDPTPPIPDIRMIFLSEADKFYPLTDPHHLWIVTIVCITRLVYRKGIDLLIAALPKVCALHPDVRFLIGMFLFPSPILSFLTDLLNSRYRW